MKAKSILIPSLLLNLALLAAGGVYVYDRPMRPAPAPVVAAKVIATARPDTAVTPETLPAPETRPLGWSDLVSSDPDVYARHLRAIGCPEETIHDLLTAAIAHRYDGQRQEIAAQYQQGRIDKLSMDTAVAQLWDAQNATVNQLRSGVGGNAAAPPSPATAVAGAPAASPPSAGGVAAPMVSSNSAIMPIALREPTPAMGLSPAQQAAVEQVGNQFAKTVNAAATLAPTDPAYHQVWQEAQSDADEQLKVQIGWEAYLQLELSGKLTQ